MTYAEAMDKAAREYLTDLLLFVRGNMSKAALIAHYDRPHLYDLVKRLGIDYRSYRVH